MTVAVVTLAAVCLALSVGLVLSVRWGMNAKDEANVSADLFRAMTLERDRTAVELAGEKQRNAALGVRLAISEKQRNEATDRRAKEVADKIRNAKTPQEAAALVNDAMNQGMKRGELIPDGPLVLDVPDAKPLVITEPAPKPLVDMITELK